MSGGGECRNIVVEFFTVPVEGVTLILKREEGSVVVLAGRDSGMRVGIFTCLVMRFWRSRWRCCPCSRRRLSWEKLSERYRSIMWSL